MTRHVVSIAASVPLNRIANGNRLLRKIRFLTHLQCFTKQTCYVVK